MQTARKDIQSLGPDVSKLTQREVSGGRIDIWLARVSPMGDPAVQRRCRDYLSPMELDLCYKFLREEDRRRAVVAKAFLRESLSRYAPVRPEDWEFVLGAHGKPEIAAPAGLRLRFNISHTRGLVACAVTADVEVGIDLEDATRKVELPELAQRVFSPEELAAFRRLEPAARRRRFFECWVLKEAYLKARGLGFTLAPQNAGFDLGEPGCVRAHFTSAAEDHPSGWWFALFGTVPGHALAMAMRSGGKPARVRTFLAVPGGVRTRQLKSRPYAETQPAIPPPGQVP